MLLDEGYPQGVEEHAFADDGGVGDASGGDEFTEGERIELENGVDDGGYGERSGDGEKEPEVFLRGRVVPKDGIGARDDDDQKDRNNKICGFNEVKVISGEDFDMLYHVEENTWNNVTSIQLNVKDIKCSD